MLRCSSATMLLHRLPPRALPAPRKPPARDPPHYSDRLLAKLVAANRKSDGYEH